jgi:hypothetical protein
MKEDAMAERRSTKPDQTKTITYQQGNCERALSMADQMCNIKGKSE